MALERRLSCVDVVNRLDLQFGQLSVVGQNLQQLCHPEKKVVFPLREVLAIALAAIDHETEFGHGETLVSFRLVVHCRFSMKATLSRSHFWQKLISSFGLSVHSLPVRLK